MKQTIENIIKKNIESSLVGEHYLIDPSLIADEVLKVVVGATISMLRDESMLAECINKTLGYGHHYSTMPVLRGIVSEIEKKLLSEPLSPNKENKNNG